MIPAALALLALLAAPPARAQLVCAEPDCYDRADDRFGQLGNEGNCVDPDQLAATYEFALEDESVVVVSSGPCLLVARTSLVAGVEIARVKVRACNVLGCGAWSDPARFLPYADLRQTNCRQRPDPDGWGCDTCEQPTQGWRRLPHLPLCPEGTP